MIFAIGAILGGLALCAAAFPRAGSRAEQLFRFAAGALLGLGISGALSMALRLAGLPAPWKDRALVVAGAAVLVAVRGRGLRLEAGVVRACSDRILAAAAAAAALLVFALFVEHTVRYPDGGWDARAIWNLHARALHRAPLRLDLAFSPEMPEAHPDYPLLVPALVADAFGVAGEDSYASGSIALAFAALLVAVVGTSAAASLGPAAGCAAALLVLGFPALLQLGATQCADVPLAALLAAACALAVHSGGRRGSLLLAGLAASLCALTKNEGLVWAAALWIAVSTAMRGRAALAMLLGGLPGFVLLLVFKLRFAPPNAFAAHTTVAGLWARVSDFHRFAAVASGLVAQSWNFASWGLAGPAVAVAAAWPLRLSSGRFEAARILRRALVLCTASLFAIYVAAPPDVDALLPVSADRLLFQLSGAAVLLATTSCFAPRR